MRAGHPRRYLLLAAALLLFSCVAAPPPQATIEVPSPEPAGKVGPPTPLSGQLSVVTAAQKPVGNVIAVYIGVANGTDATRTIHPDKVFALDHYGMMVAPLAPLEAARQAGGANQLKAAIENGPPVAAGGVADAAAGASSKTMPGKASAQKQADTQLEKLTLRDTQIRKNATVSGYLYFPNGSYTDLEMLVINNDTGAKETVTLRWH